MTRHIMLDLETMGKSPDAAIVAIGAVAFDPEARRLGDTFYVTVDLESAVRHGGRIEPDAVMWWLRQSDEARAALHLDPQPIEAALLDFSRWVEKQGMYAEVWGNGSDFDNVILGTAYDRAEIPRPWHHRQNNCYRTLKKRSGIRPPAREGVHHNALDDATHQALHAVCIMQKSGKAA